MPVVHWDPRSNEQRVNVLKRDEKSANIPRNLSHQKIYWKRSSGSSKMKKPVIFEYQTLSECLNEEASKLFMTFHIGSFRDPYSGLLQSLHNCVVCHPLLSTANSEGHWVTGFGVSPTCQLRWYWELTSAWHEICFGSSCPFVWAMAKTWRYRWKYHDIPE